jgi:hypothetical protein
MNPVAAAGPAPLAQLLRALDAKAGGLAEHLHPARVDAVWQRLGAELAACRPRLAPARHASLLAQACGLRWPTLPEWRPPAHRVALLGRVPLLRALATCALHARRDDVRRSVGRAVRSRLLQEIGETAYRRLLAVPTPGLAPGRTLEAEDVDLERLATTGYRLLQAEGAWQSRRVQALVRLSLAPDPVDSRDSTDAPDFPDSPDAPDASDEPVRTPAPGMRLPAEHGAVLVLEQLPHYFPEFAWLFGSDLDRALSA